MVVEDSSWVTVHAEPLSKGPHTAAIVEPCFKPAETIALLDELGAIALLDELAIATPALNRTPSIEIGKISTLHQLFAAGDTQNSSRII